MKRQTLTTLTAAFAFALSSTAFANVGKPKPLTIYNTTGFTLVTTYGATGNPVKFPKLINNGTTTTLYYQHLNTPEYVKLAPATYAGHNTNVFFNIANDGVHGGTATNFSYEWYNGANGVVLSICNSLKSSDCVLPIPIS